MNPALLKIGFKAAKSLWSAFNENREEKTRKAYDELEAAARHASQRAQDSEFFPRTREEAGNVTKAAHNRLERTIEELSARRDEASEKLSEELESARSTGFKLFSRGRKAARKRAKQESKRAQKLRQAALKKLGKEEKSSKFWPILGALALIAGIAGAVYYFFLRNVIEKEEPATNPPRVEEFSSESPDVEGSRLVYTSTSEASKASEGSEFTEPTPEPAPAERDEELLDSLDEQLAKHRKKEDPKEEK